MSNLVLAKKEIFDSVECDFWRDKDTNDFFMTRDQIGNALGYGNANRAISDIHNRHKARLDKYSVLRKMRTTDNKYYNTYLYSMKGIYEICRWSQQPKADAFMDFVWDIIESIRTNKMSIYLRRELSAMLNEKFNILELSIKNELNLVKSDFGKVLYFNKCKNKTKQQSDYSKFVHNTVKPLAEKYADISSGYTVTLRQVYARMGVGWTHRQTRYLHQHNLKNPPRKIDLVTRDKNLRRIFKKTIQEMLEEK